MDELEKPLNVRKRGEITQKIVDRVRRLILEKKLAIGDKLPSNHSLAKTWKTNYFTVHTALARLVDEGLIESRRGARSVVCSHTVRPKLRRIALYSSRPFQEQEEMQFYDSLYRCLLTRLLEQQIEPVFFLDQRDDLATTPFSPLQKAVNAGEVQGVIIVNSNRFREPWLRLLSLPKVFFLGSSPSVRLDTNQMFSISSDYLRQQGCRTVGLISSVGSARGKTGNEHSKAFLIEAARIGLRVRDSWIHVPSSFPESIQTYGYDAFARLWRNKSRPDGLIVYPDTCAQGVVAALLKAGVNVPEELKLVLHRQKELRFFCPFSAMGVQNSIESVADKMLQVINAQLDGSKNASAVVSYTLNPFQ